MADESQQTIGDKVSSSLASMFGLAGANVTDAVILGSLEDHSSSTASPESASRAARLPWAFINKEDCLRYYADFIIPYTGEFPFFFSIYGPFFASCVTVGETLPAPAV
jgi:hypothetical protein